MRKQSQREWLPKFTCTEVARPGAKFCSFHSRSVVFHLPQIKSNGIKEGGQIDLNFNLSSAIDEVL